MKLGHISDEQESVAELDLTPLIDVVFILLIFFLVTTTFAKELGIDVERPAATTASAQSADSLRVAIGRHGEITIDAQPVSSFRVEAEVRTEMQRDERPVLVVADRSVDAEVLVRLMDACRRGGAKHVAIAVDES